MSNPFEGRTHSLSDPSRDLVPVTPDDVTDLPNAAVALYIETGGALTFITPAGNQRTVTVTDFSILPTGALRILATGTTATGIHAFTVS